MPRKTFDDWKSLVEKQIANGLSLPHFFLKISLFLKGFKQAHSFIPNRDHHLLT